MEKFQRLLLTNFGCCSTCSTGYRKNLILIHFSSHPESILLCSPLHSFPWTNGPLSTSALLFRPVCDRVFTLWRHAIPGFLGCIIGHWRPMAENHDLNWLSNSHLRIESISRYTSWWQLAYLGEVLRLMFNRTIRTFVYFGSGFWSEKLFRTRKTRISCDIYTTDYEHPN